MMKYIVMMVLQACVMSMEANANGNSGGLTIHQIYGDPNTSTRIYSTPSDGSPPSVDIYYDRRSTAVPSIQPLDTLPGTYRNRYLLQQMLEESGYYDEQ